MSHRAGAPRSGDASKANAGSDRHNGLGIIDLASTNGTFVNDERVGTGMMADGDSITIGKSKLTLSVR